MFAHIDHRSLRPLLVAMLCVLFARSGAGSGILVPTDASVPPLRITDHLVDVQVHSQVALTELTQTFRNDTDRRLEATYIFPLPEQADLTNFQMTFNGKMVEGEVLPAEEARQIYESIVRQARDPGLIEFIGRRLLRMRVFPIEPKSETTIKLRYQQVLRPISGMRGYHYPLKTQATSGEAHGTVRFQVALDAEESIKNIWSPTHAVEIVRQGEHKAMVAYEAKGGSLEKDFILLYSTDESDLGLSAIAHKPRSDEAGHFLLLLSPKQLWKQDEYQPQDVVFVIDTSGSMGGEKIAQARDAVKYCIGQLDPRDRFNVLRFSTGFDMLFDDGLRTADEDAREEARSFISGFEAGGGTNIADTLEAAAKLNADDDDRPFVLVFMTDGRGNRDAPEILTRFTKASEEQGSLRVFPFGVGHDVNTKLLDQLAGSFTGRPTYVTPGENLELVMGDFFATISQPVLTNLSIDLPSIDVSERYPATLGDLYHGQQLTIAGRFKNELTGPVTLRATRDGKQVEYSWPNVRFEHVEEAEYVPPIWAGRKIAYLIDQIRLHGESKEMVDEIVSLSQQFGIQTPYSSWLIAPEQARDGTLAQRRGRAINVLRSDGMFAGGGGGGGRGGGNAFDFGDRYFNLPQEQGAAGQPANTPPMRPKDVLAESGRAATEVARAQEQLRRMNSIDDAQQGQSMPIRMIDGRRFFNFGAILVDENVTEKHKLVYVLFGSDAWFELVRKRSDLRKVLASSRNLIIAIDDVSAIVVLENRPQKAAEGSEIDDPKIFEQFSDPLREQLGLKESK